MVGRNDGRKPGTDGPKKGNEGMAEGIVECGYFRSRRLGSEI
jgi:hypothetical protein